MTRVTGRTFRKILPQLLCGGAFFIIGSQPAQAQSVCTSVGGILDCVEGGVDTATGTVGGSTVIIPGPGLVGGSLADVVADLEPI